MFVIGVDFERVVFLNLGFSLFFIFLLLIGFLILVFFLLMIVRLKCFLLFLKVDVEGMDFFWEEIDFFWEGVGLFIVI